MKIIRKDGIVYERKEKAKNYDKQIGVRINSNDLEILKEISKRKGIHFTKLCRKAIENYIETEIKGLSNEKI